MKIARLRPRPNIHGPPGGLLSDKQMAERDCLVFHALAKTHCLEPRWGYRTTPDGDCTSLLNTRRTTSEEAASIGPGA